MEKKLKDLKDKKKILINPFKSKKTAKIVEKDESVEHDLEVEQADDGSCANSFHG